MAPAPTIGGRPVGGPPGSSGSSGSASKRPPGSGSHDRRSELICRVKYNNTLPDIPFDPKFITCPFDNSRFISYNPTSLERNYKYELLTEHDLGIPVDLILPDAYAPSSLDGGEPAMLDPKDEKLLEDEHVSTAGDIKRSKKHALILSWMRKPDYISTEQTRFQPATVDKIESRVGYSVRKKLGAEMAASVYMDRDAQIKAIDKTFEDAQVPITHHHSDKNIYPVEVLPILPDDEMWKYPCAQVIFDSDPAPAGMSVKDQLDVMSQAMIRGVMDESGEQFVAYFLPTDETRKKRGNDASEGKEYDEEMEYEYKMAREYNWNVKSKASKGYEENYFFVKRENGIFYNELETRVRLTKRRLRQGQQPSNSKLVVKHRPLKKTEHKMQRYRERNLEPRIDEEEEEESDDDEEEEEGLPETAQNDDDNRSRSRSASGSRSRSRSGSRSRSRSRSASGSRSRSRSRSASGSRKGSSRSRSRSRSASGSRSRSGSPASRKSGSRSRSGSPAGSRSPSRSKSGSRSPSGSRGSRSRSGSPSRSGSGSD